MASRVTSFSKAGTKDVVDHASQKDVQAPNAAELKEVQLDGVKGLIDVLEREAPTEWMGKAALEYGLSGATNNEKLHEVLTRGKIGDVKIRGDDVKEVTYGIVITMPKTFSILLAGNEKQQAAVKNAMKASADAYMSTIESLLRTRQKKAGKESTAISGLIAAKFDHFSSSHGDPHAHVHLLLSSSALCEDGKFRTLDSRVMYSFKRIAEAAAIKAATESMKNDLNIDDSMLVYKTVGSVQTPEIKSLVDYIEPFSGARAHFSTVVQDLGRSLGAQTYEEDDTAWKMYREKFGDIGEKIEHAVDADLAAGGHNIRKHWLEKAGVEFENRLKNISSLENKPSFYQKNYYANEEDALKFIESLHTWNVADVASYIMKDCKNVEDAFLQAADFCDKWQKEEKVFLPDPNIKEVVDAIIHKKIMDTDRIHDSVTILADCISQKELDIEKSISESVKALASKNMPIPFKAKISDFTPTIEQEEAINLLNKNKHFNVISGVAGAGKTTIAKPVTLAAQAAGYSVHCISRNAKTAKNSGESMLADESCSVFAFVKKYKDKKMIGSRTPILLIVDESALTEREDLITILSLSNDPTNNISIVMFGDRKQAQSIDKRAGYAVIEKTAFAEGAATRLRQSFRNKDWQPEADAIFKGKVSVVEDVIEKENRLIEMSDEDSKKAIAKLIVENPGYQGIVRSNADASDISFHVQTIKGIKPNIPVAQNNMAGVGDKVRTKVNIAKLGILNGDSWEIVKTLPNGNVVLKSDEKKKKQVTVSADYALKSLELYYAVTCDSAQGSTKKRAIVLASTMGRSQIYSSSTRGIEAPLYFCRDKKTLERNIETDDEAKTALELKASIDAKKAKTFSAINALVKTAVQRDAIKKELIARARAYTKELVMTDDDMSDIMPPAQAQAPVPVDEVDVVEKEETSFYDPFAP